MLYVGYLFFRSRHFPTHPLAPAAEMIESSVRITTIVASYIIISTQTFHLPQLQLASLRLLQLQTEVEVAMVHVQVIIQPL